MNRIDAGGATYRMEDAMTKRDKVFEDIRHRCKTCGEVWTVTMLLVGDFMLPTYTGSDTFLCPNCESENTIMFSNKPEVQAG